MHQSGDGKKVCNCPHHKVIPWAIIVIGLVILLTGFNILTYMAETVVIGALLIVIGGTKLNSRKCTCCDK